MFIWSIAAKIKPYTSVAPSDLLSEVPIPFIIERSLVSMECISEKS